MFSRSRLNLYRILLLMDPRRVARSAGLGVPQVEPLKSVIDGEERPGHTSPEA